MFQSHTEHHDPRREAQLDGLLRSYREACPEPDAGPNFMPELWARIEARQSSTNLFGWVTKTLVTAALGTSVILTFLISSSTQPGTSFNGTYLEALVVDHASSLEPLSLDRVSEMELQ